MDQGAAFSAFDSALNLDARERVAAEILHRDLTSKLRRRGLVRDGFLQGSFARKTMRRPLHDVDKVLLLPPEAEGLVRSQRGGPDRVMNELEAAIVADYPGTTFERKRHALGLTIPGYHFQFDAVPAFEIPVDRAVLIANREADTLEGEWEWSNTRVLMDVGAKRNQACDGRFVHWVRMGKEMAAHRIGDNLPGLHIESLCFIANSDVASDAVACEQLFRVASAQLDTGYYDPTGHDRLSDRLSYEVRARASAEFSACSRLASEAQLLALNGDHDGACQLWRTVFGQAFPAPPPPRPEDALAASFAGVPLTSLGTPSASAQRHIRPVRSWSP
ncbi:MAG: SMODS domain-containing nucleotidyltransferase [Candidatus Dormibacteria bacterium]